MFSNYINDYAGFTTTTRGKLLLKFTIPDIKFHGSKYPHHHVRNFLSAMILKGIDNDIFHIVIPWMFIMDLIRWYNIVDP